MSCKAAGNFSFLPLEGKDKQTNARSLDPLIDIWTVKPVKKNVKSDQTFALAVGEVGLPGEAGHPPQGGVGVVKKRWATRIATWSLSGEGVIVLIHGVGRPHLLSKPS